MMGLERLTCDVGSKRGQKISRSADVESAA